MTFFFRLFLAALLTVVIIGYLSNCMVRYVAQLVHTHEATLENIQ
jgi:hypothetical protein